MIDTEHMVLFFRGVGIGMFLGGLLVCWLQLKFEKPEKPSKTYKVCPICGSTMPVNFSGKCGVCGTEVR